MPTPTALDSLDVITGTAWLLYVSVHAPRLNFKVRGGQVVLDGIQLTGKQVTLPQWKLMPDELRSQLQEVENAVSTTLDRYRVPVRSSATRSEIDAYGNERVDIVSNKSHEANKYYLLRGLHLIPDSRIVSCVQELQQHDQRLRSIVETSLEDIDAFREAVRRQLSDDVAWEKAQALLPSRGHLLTRTGIEWVPFPIGGGNQEVMAANQSEIRDTIRRRMQAFVEGMVESLVEEPRQEVHRALSDLDELIQRDGRVTARSFEPVFRAIEKLRSFGVTDAELDRRINHLQDRLATVTPAAQTRENADNNGLTAAIRDVMQQAISDVSIAAAYGRPRRGIALGYQEIENEQSAH